jgi:hypothetical protein
VALDIRDRALLLIGFAGAFRRSELVDLNVEDLEFNENGLVIHLRRSKTDPGGAGKEGWDSLRSRSRDLPGAGARSLGASSAGRRGIPLPRRGPARTDSHNPADTPISSLGGQKADRPSGHPRRLRRPPLPCHLAQIHPRGLAVPRKCRGESWAVERSQGTTVRQKTVVSPDAPGRTRSLNGPFSGESLSYPLWIARANVLPRVPRALKDSRQGREAESDARRRASKASILEQGRLAYTSFLMHAPVDPRFSIRSWCAGRTHNSYTTTPLAQPSTLDFVLCRK